MMFKRKGQTRAERQKGYALLLVLWSLVLLSLLAAMLMSQSRLAARMEANAWTAFEADELAETAAAIAVLKLYEPETHRNGALRGGAMPFEFDGVRGEIAIQDELGKLDINQAGEDALRALLGAAGASPPQAALLASRIVDWRGGRASGRPANVIAAEYAAASLSYAPRGAPFQSVGELRLVLGMTDELFGRMQGALTVFTHANSFDPNAAPEILLRAAPGVSAAAIENARRKRAAPDPNATDDEARGQLRVPLEGKAFTIAVSFEHDGRRRNYERTIRISGGNYPVILHELKR